MPLVRKELNVVSAERHGELLRDVRIVPAPKDERRHSRRELEQFVFPAEEVLRIRCPIELEDHPLHVPVDIAIRLAHLRFREIARAFTH